MQYCESLAGVYCTHMIAAQEIRQLPLPEKLALLEVLWSDISVEPNQVEVPQWHKDLLDARNEAYLAGQGEVIDWEIAKLQIERAVR